MDFIRRDITKMQRNGDIYISSKIISNSSYGGSGGGSSSGGNYLPAMQNADGTYTVLTSVLFNGNIIAAGEVAAYKSGVTSGETSGVTSGAIDVEDNLTSERTDAALSANQGRLLKEMIDNIDVENLDLSNYYTKAEVDNKLINFSGGNIDLSEYVKTSTFNSHSADTTVHVTTDEKNKWNDVYTDWNDVFEINSDGSLKVKVNLYGQGEISAYGSGSTGSTTEINLENYYTKDEIDDKLDNINVGDIDLSDYSKTSHTHSNYALSNHTHSNYSVTSHTHSNYALSNHTHSNYSVTSHTHAQYASSSHTHNYVSKVKVGTTNYNVSANTISLPAYPTLSTLGAASSTDLNNHTGNTTAHITAAERTNWNKAYTNNHTHSNKSVIDGITSTKVTNWDKVVTDWSKIFEIDSNGNLKVKVNLYGQGEISAYGSGSTGSTTEINLENYYTKDEIDDKLDNIDVGDIDLSEYSKTSHTHSNYALSNHTHAQYASSSHTHSISNITNLQSTLDGKSGTGHTHSAYSKTSHTHSNYSTTSHTHSQYASSSHIHPISAITSLQTTLDGKSGTGHSHSNYSVTSHTHSAYYDSSISRTANTVLAAPNGSNGSAKFRSLVAADIPTLAISKISNLQSTLDGKSGTGHSHSNYSVTSHTHNYAGSSSAGGAATSANKVNSTLTFTGGTFATKTFNGSAPTTVNIPTHTSHITNNSGFITTAATVTNADKLDGYHGSSSNSGNTYVLRSSDGAINVGAINASGDTNIVGNLCVTGEITAYADGGNATPFIYNATSYSEINSTATNQVPTANVAYLIKQELEDTKTRLTTAETKLTKIKNSLSGLTSSSSLSTVVTALINLKNNI